MFSKAQDQKHINAVKSLPVFAAISAPVTLSVSQSIPIPVPIPLPISIPVSSPFPASVPVSIPPAYRAPSAIRASAAQWGAPRGSSSARRTSAGRSPATPAAPPYRRPEQKASDALCVSEPPQKPLDLQHSAHLTEKTSKVYNAIFKEGVHRIIYC